VKIVKKILNNFDTVLLIVDASSPTFFIFTIQNGRATLNISLQKTAPGGVVSNEIFF